MGILANSRHVHPRLREAMALGSNGKSKVQLVLVDLIANHGIKFDADAFLRKRWRRWFAGAQLEDSVKRAAIVRSLLEGMPPFCLSAMLCTWLNGWVTDRRFQRDNSACVFGCSEEDSLEHYACCDILWSVMPDGMTSGRRCTLSALLLTASDAIDRVEAQKGAVLNYIALQTYNHVKHSNVTPSKHSLRNIVNERMRFACGRSKKVRIACSTL